jgi:hypothetical protein
MFRRLESASAAGAVALALTMAAPAAGQDSVRYDLQIFVGRGDKTFTVYQALPLDQGTFWTFCVFGWNDEQRAKRIKYSMNVSLVDRDAPFELVEDLGGESVRVKLQRDGQDAYGEVCYDLTAFDADFALVRVDLNTATAGRVRADTDNEYGVYAYPVPDGFDAGAPLEGASGRLERSAGPGRPTRAK